MDKATASKRLEEERTRLQGIRDNLQREQEEATSVTSCELSSFDQHPGDSGTETFEMEKNVSLLEQVEDELQEIEVAFQRLERGTYGSCQACGRPIGDERLEARCRPPASASRTRRKAEREAGYRARAIDLISRGLSLSISYQKFDANRS
jgi:RNA polymerase-binding transcription factor DksA